VLIRVISSPWEADYTDPDETPPWEYDEEGFIDWVDEVFCEAGRPDLELDEALDIIQSNKYQVEVIDE